MVYMGSTVVYGRGRAVITGTGMKTEMGKIAHVLTQSADESTPLQKRLNQLSKILSVMVLAICAVIFIVGILKEGVTPQNILNTFMVAVSPVSYTHLAQREFAASTENNGFGKTYVEVDASRQHIWLYKDGNLVVDGDCVTCLLYTSMCLSGKNTR